MGDTKTDTRSKRVEQNMARYNVMPKERRHSKANVRSVSHRKKHGDTLLFSSSQKQLLARRSRELCLIFL